MAQVRDVGAAAARLAWVEGRGRAQAPEQPPADTQPPTTPPLSAQLHILSAQNNVQVGACKARDSYVCRVMRAVRTGLGSAATRFVLDCLRENICSSSDAENPAT